MRHIIVLSYFVLHTLLLPASGEIISVSGNKEIIQITGNYLQVAEDATKLKTFNEIVTETWKPLSMRIPNFGFENSSFWLKATIANTTDNYLEKILEIKNPNLDKISIVILRANGDTLYQEAGDSYPWEHRIIKNKYFQFILKFFPKESLNVYINLQNSGEQFQAPMSIGSPEQYKLTESKEQVFFGLYFGIIIFALLLNLFFYFVLADHHLLYYLGYLLGLLLLQLSFTGVGFQYFWPDSIYLANRANPIFANLSVLFLLHFCIHFLQTKAYVPALHKLLKSLSFIIILPALFAWIPGQLFYTISVLSINIITMLLNILIIPTSIIIWNRKYKPARFFTIAFVILSLSVFVFIFKNFGLLPPTMLTEFGLQIGSAAEVLLLTLAVIDRFKQFKDDGLKNLNEINRLKTEANIELEKKVVERTAEINRQKFELEEKQKEILDSIYYAKRIQNALMASDEVLNKNLGEYFVFYKPKDIVSGDFYWATYSDSTAAFYLAVCDCTGHGVPGAFMSLLNTSYLNEAINEKSISDCGNVFNHVRKKLIENISQEGAQDGMDGIIISISKQNATIKYAAAHNAPLLVRNGHAESLNCNKMPIGKSFDTSPFQSYSLNIQNGDTLYLFTDGYPDQFGGEKGKKLKYKNFVQTLLSISVLPMAQQKKELEKHFEKWKGNLEQLDDVLVVGLRF